MKAECHTEILSITEMFRANDERKFADDIRKQKTVAGSDMLGASTTLRFRRDLLSNISYFIKSKRRL